MLVFTAAGLFVGFAVGVTGVGGGSLMTPLLILLFGFSPAVAVGTDLLYAAGTKAFGVWLHGRQQTIEWRVVFRLASGSVPASLATVAWLHYVGIDDSIEHLMTLTLCVAIVATAILTLIKQRLVAAGKGGKASAFLNALHGRWQAPITVGGGVVLGVLVTMSSVGAGVLGTTLLLLLYPRLSAITIVGTDIAHAVPLTLIAGLGHISLGTPDFTVLIYLLLGSLPGIWLGTRIGYRLPEHVLRPIIAIMLIIIGVVMFVDTISSTVTS